MNERTEAEVETQEERQNFEENCMPIPESDLFTEGTMELIQDAKEKNASAFQSYWEADEENIENWTDREIDLDPAKKLITLAEYGKLEEIKQLVSQLQSDPNWKVDALLVAKDSDGYTAMHRACYSNMLEVVKYLLELEANCVVNGEASVNQLEARTEMGWTPLHSAVYWNSYQVVEYLLKCASANPNLKSNSGQTCLHLAAQQSTGRESLLLLLTHPRIDFNARNDQNETAYDIARRSCKYNALFEMTEENLNRL
jgi:hypothetical protein